MDSDKKENTQLFDNLSSFATASSLPRVDKKYSSRFFFRIKPTISEIVKKRKAAVAPVKLDHIDDGIIKRTASYSKELPPTLSDNIDKVREFFLNEINPLTLAVKPGAEQASEVSGSVSGVQTDSGVLLQFERMLAKGVNLKMATFICEYLHLDKKLESVLVEAISPVRKEAVFISDPLGPQPKDKWTPAGEKDDTKS